jgi:hypothetical protein
VPVRGGCGTKLGIIARNVTRVRRIVPPER